MIRCPSLLRNLIPLARMLLMFLMDAWRFLLLCLRPSPALAAENLFLRKQLALYQERQIKPRRTTQATRMVLAWLARWFDWRHALVLVQPATLIRWHRQGFRWFWRWTSGPGRPPIPADLQALIRRVAQGKALPPEVAEQIVAKTDGVPLFVEELTKMVLESGLLREQEDRYALTGPLPPLAIPATLHDSLMARLDRLATVKALAQLGATLGREFSYELLQAVAPWDEATLQRGLHQLVAAEFLYQRGLPPQATYRFKHALIQEEAYQSLLRSTRQRHHQRIAQVLEARLPEVCETQPELLAHHYTEAGLAEQAIPHWQRAGERAVQRSAYIEATAHLIRGLEVLTALPNTPERIQRELDLQLTLGPALMALKGFGAPEVEQTYTQAYELCQQLQMDASPQLLRVLYGLRRVYTHRGDPQKAQEISEQYLRLAQQLHDVHMQIDAYYSLGLSLIERGDVIAGQAACEHGMTLDTRPLHGIAASGRTANDPGVACRTFAAWSLWVRGYPEQALRKADEALTLAQTLANPFVCSHALIFVAWLHQYRREIPAMRERVEAAIALASEHAYIQQWAWGTILRGWGVTDRAEGLTQMRQGLDAALAIGTGGLSSLFVGSFCRVACSIRSTCRGIEHSRRGAGAG
jgi:tetratricopeptide (TPR) repeat protein